MVLEAAGLVIQAMYLRQVVDSGHLLEVQLENGNVLRFVGAEAQRLRTQLNLLLEELLRWHRRLPTPANGSIAS